MSCLSRVFLLRNYLIKTRGKDKKKEKIQKGRGENRWSSQVERIISEVGRKPEL